MSLLSVFDTNVWVSAFLNPRGFPARLLHHWQEGHVETVISLPLIEELADVLFRPRLTRKYQYLTTDVTLYLTLIAARSRLVHIGRTLSLCRDLKDNIVLETAMTGQAKVVVPRDDDLKRDPIMHQYAQAHGFRILSVSQCLSDLRTAPP